MRRNGNPLRAERDVWLRLKYRTQPGKHRTERYANVTLCEEWLKSFAAFFAHVGPIPGEGYSIDRIDNRKGYEPGNVRWATREVQARNRRGYGELKIRGIYPQDGRFRVRIRVGGKLLSLGMFPTLDDATAARDQAELQHWGTTYSN